MITPSDNSHLLSADMLNLAGNHLQKSGLHNEAIQLFTKAFWLVKDTSSFMATAAAADALQGFACCMQAMGNPEGFRAAAHSVKCLTAALQAPARRCEELLLQVENLECSEESSCASVVKRGLDTAEEEEVTPKRARNA